MHPAHFLIITAVGAGLSLGLGGLAVATGWADDGWAHARDQGLVAASLLLLPASIFPAAVGAMFPHYWNATPVMVVRHSPINDLLRYVAGVLGYSVASLMLPASAPVAIGLVALVLIGVALATRAIAYSLALMDPVRLAKLLKDTCVHDKSARRARQAFGDLCRLVRGYRETQRKTACAKSIRYLTVAWTQRRADLSDKERKLALRVLGECSRAWPSSSGEVAKAVFACWKAIAGASR